MWIIILIVVSIPMLLIGGIVMNAQEALNPDLKESRRQTAAHDAVFVRNLVLIGMIVIVLFFIAIT